MIAPKIVEKNIQLVDLPVILEKFETIIFDIGDVILNWDSKHLSSTDNQINDLRQIIKHPLWKDYERGKLTKEVATSLIEFELKLPNSTIKELLELSKTTLRVDWSMLDLLRQLKANNKRLLCFTNMDRDSFSFLFETYDFWEYFELIYVSSLLNLSKPNLNAFQFLMDSANLYPEQTIFLDNSEENLIAAREFIWHTINVSTRKFVSLEYPSAQQKSLTTKMERAKKYLYKNLQKSPLCRSFVAKNIELIQAEEFSKEIFSTILILHISTTLPEDIVEAMCHEVLNHNQEDLCWCFYTQSARPSGFPADLDTTSMALSYLLKEKKISREQANAVAQKMIKNRNEDGIIQVYFDDYRQRIDATVAVNVLYLMHQLGYGITDELKDTKNYIASFLKSQAYLNGTRYYPLPEAFLFFLSRLVSNFPEYYQDISSKLKSTLIKHIGTTSYPIDSSLRVLALKQLGIINRIDLEYLLDNQLNDGGWAANGLFIAARSKEYFGSRELTSVFALEALKVLQ